MGGFLGKHAIYDIEFDINSSILKGGNKLMGMMEQCCIDAGATILKKYKKKFDGGGFTFTLILAESHASCHTWPEHGIATLDIFMCGECDPYVTMNSLVYMLQCSKHKPKKFYQTKIGRGWVV